MGKPTDETILNELKELTKEKNYTVLNADTEAADVLSVDIEIGSGTNKTTKKICVYIYEDRFVFTTGFGHFDILYRNGIQKTAREDVQEIAGEDVQETEASIEAPGEEIKAQEAEGKMIRVKKIMTKNVEEEAIKIVVRLAQEHKMTISNLRRVMAKTIGYLESNATIETEDPWNG